MFEFFMFTFCPIFLAELMRDLMGVPHIGFFDVLDESDEHEKDFI